MTMATTPDRCCCGRIKNFTEPIIIGPTLHERLGDDGASCGPVNNHITRDQGREIEKLRAVADAVEELPRGLLFQMRGGAEVAKAMKALDTSDQKARGK